MGSFASMCPHSQPNCASNTSVLSWLGQQWATLPGVREVNQSCKEALMEDILFPLTHGKANSTHICIKVRGSNFRGYKIHV